MGRFKELKFGELKYFTDIYLMRGAFVVVFLFLLFVLNYDGFSGKLHLFVSCEDKPMIGKCYNPAYQSNLCGTQISSSDPLCTTEFLYPGQTLGDKPPFYIEHFATIGILFLLVVLLINTLVYNKGFFKKFYEGLKGLEL